MAIYKPELVLSQADKDALVLLGQLALATEATENANIPANAVALSPSEAIKLIDLLEQFAMSKLFAEGSYFAEGIGNGDANSDERLQGIYVTWRSRRGFTNIMANQRWREFVLRAGFNSSEDAWMWPHNVKRTPIRPMKLEHFLEMESRLVAMAHLHPRVQKLVMQFVERSLPNLEALREHKTAVRPGSLRSFVGSFISDLADHVRGSEKTPMTRHRVIALSTIVMDTAALFATRDWTATGVLSGMAAVAPDAMGYST